MSLLANLKSLFGSKCNVATRFELLREAISGTMSTFYMVRDRQSGQIVGLKLLDPQKLLTFESRFKGLKKPSEGEVGATIQHPLVNRTLEYGQTTDGLQYIVLEYLDGPGLNSVIVGKNPRLEGRRVAPVKAGRRGVAGGSRGRIHSSRRLPAKFRLLGRFGIAQADRLRPERAGDSAVHAARQSDGHGQLSGSGNRPPPADRSPGGHFFVRRDGLRTLRGSVAVGEGDRSGGVGP